MDAGCTHSTSSTLRAASFPCCCPETTLLRRPLWLRHLATLAAVDARLIREYRVVTEGLADRKDRLEARQQELRSAPSRSRGGASRGGSRGRQAAGAVGACQRRAGVPRPDGRRVVRSGAPARGVHRGAEGEAASDGEDSASGPAPNGPTRWPRDGNRVSRPSGGGCMAGGRQGGGRVRRADPPEVRHQDVQERHRHRCSGGDEHCRRVRGARPLHGLVSRLREPDHRGPRQRVLHALRPCRRGEGEGGRRRSRRGRRSARWATRARSRGPACTSKSGTRASRKIPRSGCGPADDGSGGSFGAPLRVGMRRRHAVNR